MCVKLKVLISWLLAAVAHIEGKRHFRCCACVWAVRGWAPLGIALCCVSLWHWLRCKIYHSFFFYFALFLPPQVSYTDTASCWTYLFTGTWTGLFATAQLWYSIAKALLLFVFFSDGFHIVSWFPILFLSYSEIFIEGCLFIQLGDSFLSVQ